MIIWSSWKAEIYMVVTYKMHYVGTTFTMKMNSNDKILCDNIVNKQDIYVLKWP